VGLITGTTSTPGTYNFTVEARDFNGATVQTNYSIVVAPSTPRLVSAVLPNVIVNQTYSTPLRVQGGTSPYTFALVSGNLPAGLTLSSSGVISGSATATGAFPVTVRLTDGSGQTSQVDLVINVNSSNFSINQANLPDGFINTRYTGTLTASGGSQPIVYLLSTGSLPPGVVLNMNGTLAGTPTAAGTYRFVVRAYDGAGQSAQLSAMMRVLTAGLTSSQGGLANGRVGQAYTSTLGAFNGTSPYTFSVVSGSLPPGLRLAPNGNVSGVPTSSGLFMATIRVMDATGATSQTPVFIFVAGNGVSFSTYTLPSARPNQSFNTTLQATGGSAPYTFELAGGTLPQGLTLSSTGLLSGIPTQTTAPAPFTVRVTDSTGASSLVTYMFNINSSGLALTNTQPASGQVGRAYSYTFASNGGSGAVTYTVDSGALPPGLTLGSNGSLSGTPTAPGTYVITIRATDGNNVSSLFSQVIVIGDSALGFSSNQVPDVTVNTAYTTKLAVSGGTGPYTFTLASGALPSGLTLAADGTVSGTATTPGSYPVSLRVTDSTGGTAVVAITFIVKATVPVSIVTTALPSGSPGTMYEYTIVATGGQAPYTFALAPESTLPTGLSLSTAGVLSGAVASNRTESFVVVVTDAAGATSRRTLTLIVGAGGPRLPNATLPAGTVGTAYDLTLAPAGGTAPYMFSIVSGAVPGVTLSSTGVFSGSPTTVGNYPIIIRVVDANGSEVQQVYLVQVRASTANSLAFTTTALPAPQLGQMYQATLQATGGVAPYTFSAVTALPAGLTLASNGSISGSVPMAGQYFVTFRVTDANGATANTTIVMSVN
jgi:hypothetical protein